MKKVLIFSSITLLGVPLLSSALVAPPTTLVPPPKKTVITEAKKRVSSGELRLNRLKNQQNSMSGKTSTGRIIPPITGWSGTLIKPKQKSALELAVERQKQREKDLEEQHAEQRETEDKQRAAVVAWEAKKKAEELARKNELEKRQDNETIEAYCNRAERQGFLLSKLRTDTVQKCIDKLKAFEAVGKRIAQRKLKEAMSKKQTLEDALKKRCLEAIGGNRPVPAACKRSTSGSGTTQSGGTLATF